MKKVFMQFGSGLGPMSRSLPIALALGREGYQIKYMGYQSAKPYMKEVGIEELNENYSVADIVKEVPNPYWNTADEFWTMIGYGNMPWVEKKVDELIDYLKQYKPDYILSDLGILACLAARIMDIPLITINQSCYHPNNQNGGIKWWDSTHSETTILRDKLNQFLKRKGAPLLQTFTEIFTGTLTLIPSFQEFDPISNLEQYNTHYVGPILWEKEMKVSEQVKHIYETTRPKIFCYMARFLDNVGDSGKAIFEAMLKSAHKLDAEIIISTGSLNDTKQAYEMMRETNYAADNLLVVDYLPMSYAYGKSDLVIHHGGHGSCLAQFKYGVPSVIIPTHTEREYNARTIDKMKVGRFILRDELCSERLEKSILQVMNDKSYKDEIMNIRRRVMNEFNQLDKVVTLVNSL